MKRSFRSWMAHAEPAPLLDSFELNLSIGQHESKSRAQWDFPRRA